MGERSERIKSLNQSETEVLHYLFRDPNFKVKDIARELFRGEGGIRTNLTTIYSKLDVPDSIQNKRIWVFREYSEAYEYVFHQDEWEAKQAAQRVAQQPELFIKPPDPELVFELEDSEDSEYLEGEPELQPETNNPTQSQPTTGDLVASVVFFLIAFFVAIGLGIYVSILSVTDIQIAKLDPIYYENFESEEISQGLEIIGDPFIEYGLLNSVEGLLLILGDDTWGDYTMYISVVQYACDIGEGGYSTNSNIGVRNFDWNYYPAFRFKTCEHSSPNIIKLRISVIGDLVEIKYIDWSKAPFPQNKSGNADANTGGIFIELDKSTAIDYILVVPNP